MMEKEKEKSSNTIRKLENRAEILKAIRKSVERIKEKKVAFI